MPYAQDEAGTWWEVDASGNVVGPAQQASPAPAVVAPNAARVAREQREANNEAALNADRAADNARADRAEGRQQEAADLNAELKRLQIAKAAAEAGGGRDRLSRLNQLVRQINRVQELYDKNIGATDGVMGLRDYLPLNDNARFDAAGAALSQQGLAAFRVPGTGTVSDRDAMMFDRANLPTAATRDAAIEEQLLGLRSRVEEELRTLGQPVPQWIGNIGGEQDTSNADAPADRDPAVAASVARPNDGTSADDTPPSVWDGPGGSSPPPVAPASGATRSERDDRVSAQVDAMINAGASDAMINAVLQQQGFAPAPLGSIAAAREWMQQNPGKPYYGANATREVPLTMLQQIAGSPLGAGVAQYANAATAGTAGALAGDRGRGALDAMEAMNPNASMAGSILGGITGAAAGEAALVARAPAALARYAPRMADAIYGGLFGFNEAGGGEGLEGAATGAGLGVLGGFLGERAMRAAGSGIRGVTNPAVQALRDRNIPLTFGQAVGQSGRVGAALKKTEDALTSIPIIGNMVDARRTEGLEGFNRAAFEVGAETTGGQVQDVGGAGIAQLRQLVGDTYDRALGPARLDLANDPQALADITGASLTARSIPQIGDDAAGAIDYRVGGGMAPDGTMAGRDFQEAYRGLAQDGRASANGPYAAEFAGTMRMGQDALAGALERQNPGAYDGFLAANAANRRMNVLADAVGRAKNTDDQLFTPAQLNMADDASANRLTGRVNASTGNRPFADLAQAGQRILPSRLPDSGTATRSLLPLAGLGAAGGTTGYAAGGTDGASAGAGLTLGTILALTLGGSRAGQRVLSGAVLNRPAAARALGEALERRAQLGGGFGAGVLSPLTVGQ